jgi:hypothetical protein
MAAAAYSPRWGRFADEPVEFRIPFLDRGVLWLEHRGDLSTHVFVSPAQAAEAQFPRPFPLGRSFASVRRRMGACFLIGNLGVGNSQ